MAKSKSVMDFSPVSLFYFASGVALLIVMVLPGSLLLHVGALAVLSLVASYGLGAMKRWAIVPAAVVSLSGTAFGCTTVFVVSQMYLMGWADILLLLAMIAYVALLVISISWIVLNKEKFS